MSVYQARDRQGKLKSPYWQYDFKIKVQGRETKRFHGSTGQKTKVAARKYEDRLKELAALGQLSSEMTINEACWQYWDEVGQFKRSAKDIATNLEYVRKFLGADDDGKDRRLVDLTPADVSQAATRRLKTPVQRHRIVNGTKTLVAAQRNGKVWMPSESTVNRNIIEPLQEILIRAKRVWGIPVVLDDFDWGELTYAEAAERDRQLSVEEEERLWENVREDYHPLIEIYLISGRRLSDWIGLKKFKVDRTSGVTRFPTRKRKEKGELTIELTPRELEIVKQEWDKCPHSEFVFTYIVRKPRTINGKKKALGERHPITVAGFREVTDAAFKAAGIENFRRHDLRHTFASRFRKMGGDMKALQNAMDHQDAKSTMRYTHVMPGDLIELKSRVTAGRKPELSRNSTGAQIIEIVKKSKSL